MGTIILLVVLALVALWVVGAYNSLIGLKNQVANAWKQIDVQLKRRHDLIPNLVGTVKGAMEFERSTLEAVISARNKAVSATGVRATAQAEGELTQALGRFFAVAEAYPELKSNQNVLQLQEELTTTENQIGFSRQHYNSTVREFNTSIQVFPNVLIAGPLGFRERVDALHHLQVMQARLILFTGIRCQKLVAGDKPLPLTNMTCPKLRDPDGVQYRKQPPVNTRTGHVLTAFFKRADAGGLNQLFGDIPVSRQHQPITPET